MNNKEKPIKRLIFGVATNDSNYVIQHKINNKSVVCPFYSRWYDMIKRCYSEKFQKRNPAYIGCTVCEEWLVFGNFKVWMEKQDWRGKCLDKDILHQGNKIYSSDNCMFVSVAINNLILGSNAARGEYPKGVCFDKRHKKFVAYVNINGKRKHIGFFLSVTVAYNAYKSAKYSYIAEIANQQLEPLRSALLSYNIDL